MIRIQLPKIGGHLDMNDNTHNRGIAVEREKHALLKVMHSDQYSTELIALSFLIWSNYLC